MPSSRTRVRVVTPELVREALAFIPPDVDRDTWARVGMAIKAELTGANGFELWDEWSARSEAYDKRNARDTWRSIKASGATTIGTLFGIATSLGLGVQQIGGAAPRQAQRLLRGLVELYSVQLRERGEPAEGRAADAYDEAIEAARLSPELVPAAAMAARAYVALGKPKNAAKVVKTAWAKEPHPDLAAAFAEIAPAETPVERVKRFGELTRTAPDHPETKMLLAELEIAAENFPGARRALGNLVDSQPTARVMTLMAAIERGEGSGDSTVKAWLARALTAPRGPQWICDNCGHVHAEWLAICENCQAFDTLSWKQAPTSAAMTGSAAAMLPLIVGAMENGAGPAAKGSVVVDHPLRDADSQPAGRATAT